MQRRRVADDGDEDRGAEDGADLAEGGVDRAGGGETVVGDVADGGRAEGREGEADADSGQDRPGEPEAEPVGCCAGRAQDHHARREEERPRDDHRPVAEAVGETAGRAGDDGRERRPGQGCGAGLEDRVAPDPGEEEDVAEDQREEGGGEEQGAEVADAEGAVPEQRRLDYRARVPGAAHDHAAQQRRRCREGAKRRGRGPTPIVALDDGEGDERQRQGQHQSAGQVGQAAVEPGALAQATAPEQHDRGAEGQVDEEDQPPVRSLDQRPSERRPDRGSRSRGGPPEADPSRSSLGREGVEDQGQRGRGDHRGTDALHDAEGDQKLERGSGRAEQARRGEPGDAEQEDPLVAEAVGEAARGHQQRRDDDEVAVEDPGEGIPAGTGKGRRDVRKGDVDDGRVEKGEEGARTCNRDDAFMSTVIHRSGL